MAYGEEDSGGLVGGIVAAAVIGGLMYWLYIRQAGGGCTKTCTAGSHLDSATCTCVPDSCTKTCPSGQHVDNTCTCVPNSTNGGSVPTGTQWYKANGPTLAMPRARCSSSKCGAGSGNSGGNRWENNASGWGFKTGGGLEVVLYFQIKAGAMCPGGHIGLKHGGPNHTSPCDYSFGGSCCCWWDCGIDNDHGQAYVEIERPHPHNLNRKYFAAAGTKLDSGKPIGFRWHISKEGAGFRLMAWIDTSGTTGANKWREVYNVLDTGQFMPTDYYSHITNLQNIEIRISDVACGDITMLQGPTSRRILAAGSSFTSYGLSNITPYRLGQSVVPMIPV